MTEDELNKVKEIKEIAVALGNRLAGIFEDEYSNYAGAAVVLAEVKKIEEIFGGLK